MSISDEQKKRLISSMEKHGFQAVYNKFKNRDAVSFSKSKDAKSGAVTKKAVLEFITKKGPRYRTKAEQEQEGRRIKARQTKDYQKGRGAPYAGGKRVKISQEDIDLAEEKGRIAQRQEAAAKIGGPEKLSPMQKEAMRNYRNVDSLEPQWLFGAGDAGAADYLVGGAAASYPAYKAGKWLLPKSLRTAGKIAKAVGNVRLTTKARQEAAKKLAADRAAAQATRRTRVQERRRQRVQERTRGRRRGRPARR